MVKETKREKEDLKEGEGRVLNSVKRNRLQEEEEEEEQKTKKCVCVCVEMALADRCR